MKNPPNTLQWMEPVTLPVEELIARYYRPQRLAPLCILCENYGNNYACPPMEQDMEALLRQYQYIRLYAARLPMPPDLPKEEISAFFIRGMQPFNRRLLASEEAEPGGMAVAPGQCVICRRCARSKGKPCRHPERLRLSMDAFLLEITQILAEQFHAEVQWYNDQPPPCLMMMGGLLLP